MTTESNAKEVPTCSIPRERAVLCIDCDCLFHMTLGRCPTCASEMWSPLLWDARYIIGTVKKE